MSARDQRILAVLWNVRLPYFPMSAETPLDRLIARAVEDSRLEPLVLRTLLDMPLYAHAPLSDDTGRLRLVQFTCPDGLMVIPIFGDALKAERAGQGVVRVVCLQGRRLFEATRGATFMLNPNDTSTVLYPEEIAALLNDGFVAPAPVAATGPELELLRPQLEDEWLFDVLVKGLTPIREVTSVHLVAARCVDGVAEADRLLVVVDAPKWAAERIARSIALAVSRADREPHLPLDVSIGTQGASLEKLDTAGPHFAWTRDLDSHSSTA